MTRLPICILAVSIIHYSQAQSYRLPPWPNGAKVAVSLTFDDNCSGQFSHAQPAIDAKGFKGSFFVNPISSPCSSIEWQCVAQAFAAGHEIGSHTLTHPNLRRLDSEVIENEIRGAVDTLQRRLGPEVSPRP